MSFTDAEDEEVWSKTKESVCKSTPALQKDAPYQHWAAYVDCRTKIWPHGPVMRRPSQLFPHINSQQLLPELVHNKGH
jgi:hypothetical protein